MVNKKEPPEKEGQEMSRYTIATNKHKDTKKEIRERRLIKKKTYKSYTRNQQLRQADPNIRKIRDGNVVSVWVDKAIGEK